MSEIIRAVLGDEVVAGLPANYLSALECELAAEILKDPELSDRLATIVVRAAHQARKTGGSGRST